MRIEAYPSHHIVDIRGLPNVSIIILDESAFFPLSQATEARDASECYIGKSNPYILLISTPNTPGDLMEMISKEPVEKCIYHRIYLDYTYGLNKIYSTEEIEQAMRSPQREYNLKYDIGVGNIIQPSEVVNEL